MAGSASGGAVLSPLGTFITRLVEPQPAGNVLDCPGADPTYLLEISGAVKRGVPPGLLPKSITKGNNRPSPCQSHARQPRETDERSGIRIEGPGRTNRRRLRPSRSTPDETERQNAT